MFSLAPYRLSISVGGDIQRLAFDADASEVGAWFFNFFSKLSDAVKGLPDKRLMRVERIETNADLTFVCAIVHTGEYGFESKLYDSEESKIKHNRSVTEAELIPFFVSIAVPKDAEWGVVTLQRFKNYGIRDFIAPALIDTFEHEKKAKMSLERLVPATFVQQLYNDASIKAMKFVRYSLPDDIANALGKDLYTPHVQEVELVVKAKRKGVLPKIAGLAEVIAGTKNYSDVVAIQDWDYDAIKLEMDFAGRRRTIELGKPYKATPNLDITEEVGTGPDGHPVWEHLVAISATFSGELMSHADHKVVIDTKLTKSLIAAPLPMAEGQPADAVAAEPAPAQAEAGA
ncbi:hypothetical protein [Burkholderia gladioli]|uniref:hypothetical protein n=1 Tax=Burkholderia gladioli TaxID=28095 RepID=UPI00163E8DCB|nr:hypothetical protein [Burkholderia gladioli]MBJ9661023.1 hypothetical protein [Burkholderia gladioli]MBU9197237.1 hypothetical protein [Burkholderia gladioli]